MIKTTLIIPCYNEENRIPLNEIAGFLNNEPSLSLILVNDGSQDGTGKLLSDFTIQFPGRVIFLDSQPNSGKAEAVRKGMLKAIDVFPEAEYIGFWDADLSTPLTELYWFETIDGGAFTHDIIVGTRVGRLGAKIHRSMLRHYMGRVFATFASLILKLPVYDTQCGAKLFRRNLVSVVFEWPFQSKWLFDVEIFARLISEFGREKIMNSTLEVPLRVWKDVKGSKLRISDMAKVPMELLRIRYKYRKLRK